MVNDRTQIEEIKNRIDIVSIIERYVKLKNTGKNFTGLCPFHTEKTPSFTVTPSIQMYKCFGCGKSGDVINFLEQIEHLEFIEALEKLAQEAGVELKKIKTNSTNIKLYEINEIAAETYYNELLKNISAKKYLVHERKLNKESVDEFKIGYAPGGTILLDKIKSKFTKKELLLSGLFTEKNGNIKDRFFQRIIFPIQDQNGKIMGFTGRNLPTSTYGPKYLHTPETPLFKKRELMYGLHQSKTTIREQDLCIICEGTTDVISAHQRNIKNIVAPLGTAVTEGQLKLISRYTKNILLLLDNDNAGKEALERYFTIGIPLGIPMYTNTIEPYKDLDELMKNDSMKITKIIEEKKDLFAQLLIQKLEKKDLSDHKDYQNMIIYTSFLLSYIKDNSSKEFFAKKAQEITTINMEYFNNPSIIKKEQNTKEDNNKTKEKITNELFFLALIIYFEDNNLVNNLDITYILDKEVQKILKYIQENTEWNEKQLTKKFPNSPLIEKAILESSGMHIDKSKKDKYILNTYKIIKQQNIEKLIQSLKIKERIAIEKQKDEKIDKITTEIIRLKTLLNE